MLNLKPIVTDTEAIRATRHWSLNQDLAGEVEQPLLESIERFGILHPPIVRQSAQTYEIICGSKRIAAAQQLSLKQITCMVLDDTVENKRLLMLVAEDQNLSGPLSAIQTARLLTLAEAYDLLQDRSLQRLTGVPGSAKRRQLMRLLALDEAIRSSIHAEKCSVQTGLFLLELAETDRSILFKIVSNLLLNANKQRRVIELSRIIAANRQCSIGNVFTTDYPEIVEKRIDNIPQKTALLMKGLFRDSHPLSSQAEELFRKRVEKLKLPDHFRITHSLSFEQDTVTFEIDFPRFEDLQHRWEEIRHYWD